MRNLLAWAVPLCMGLSAQPQVAFVEKLSSTVSFYDLASGALLQRIPVGAKPHEFALNRERTELFVTIYGLDRYDETLDGGRAIDIIDMKSRKRTGQIELGPYRRPHGIELGHQSGYFYITTDIPAAIHVVDPKARRVLRTFELPDKLPHMVAVTENERTIYTANAGSASVGVIDVASGKYVRSIPIGGVPMGLQLSLDEKTLFATNRTGNAVAVIDTASNVLRRKIDISGEPVRMALAPGGKMLLVTNIGSGDVAVVDTKSLQIVRRFPVGSRSEGIRADFAGGRLFVSAQADNLVKVFSLDDYRLLTTIKAGDKPDPILLID